MLEFIDTHNHILPGVDDGATDVDVSIAMARVAAGDGITTIIATPHVVEGLYEGYDLDERVTALQAELDRQAIALRLIKGAEVPMSICMSGDTARLRHLAVGGRYLLMESAETNFEQVSRAVYQVRLSGFYPVLAHPERTAYAQKSLDQLEELVARDEVYCQLTVASLEGLFGSAARKACGAMAKRGLVHLLASDAHSAGRRAPRLAASYAQLSQLAGEEAARIAVFDNPGRMIDGKPLLHVQRDAPSGRTSLARRLFRLR
ncbi:MAG: tyrosine-protein phosphatase [Thermoleophilia bacterium]